MEAVATILFAAGLVVQAIAGLWLLIEMFKTGPAWGLVQMFCCGLTYLVWLMKYWQQGKEPFLIQLMGLVMMGVGFGMGYRGVLFQFLWDRSSFF